MNKDLNLSRNEQKKIEVNQDFKKKKSISTKNLNH